jgi:hypothetical protein
MCEFVNMKMRESLTQLLFHFSSSLRRTLVQFVGYSAFCQTFAQILTSDF